MPGLTICSVWLQERTVELLRGRIISSSIFERNTARSTSVRLLLLENLVSLADGQDNVDSVEYFLRVGVTEWSTSDSTTKKELISRLGSYHFPAPRAFITQDLLLDARTRTMIAVTMTSTEIMAVCLGKHPHTRPTITNRQEFALQMAIRARARAATQDLSQFLRGLQQTQTKPCRQDFHTQ